VNGRDERHWVIRESAGPRSFSRGARMAQSRLPKRKIRDVLRLSAAGLSKRQIAGRRT
jgi:hypothetical protein